MQIAKPRSRKRRRSRNQTTPQPVKPNPTTPRKPRSTSAKQAGQAAARSNKFVPKPLGTNKPRVTPPNKSVPRSAPNLGSAAKLAATQAAKNTARFFSPTRKAALAIGAVTAIGGAISSVGKDNKPKPKTNTSNKPSSSTTSSTKKRIPSMTISQARQEVALAKRAQERKQLATTGTAKKITKKQTEWRQNRRAGTSKEAMLLVRKNRNRPRG